MSAPSHSTVEPTVASAVDSPTTWLPWPVMLGLCAVVLVARRPDALTQAQFWAEDGAVFFLQARELGWRAILEPYAGYLHLIPRLVAAAATALDPAHAPLAYALAAGAGTLHVCALALRRPLVTWGRWAGAAALAVVLVPDAREVLWVLTNLQWVLAPGLVLLALGASPSGRLGHVHDLALILLAGLTGPLIVIVAPLFIWRARRNRTPQAVTLAAAAIGTAILQAGLAAGQLHLRPQIWSDWPLLGAAAGLRVWDTLLLGGRLTQPGNVAAGWFLLVIGALACLRGIRVGTPGAAERTALLGLAGAATALGLLRCQEFAPLLFQPGNGSRYFFPSLILLAWFGLSVLSSAGPRGKLPAAVVLGAFLGGNLTRLRETPLPDLGWARAAAEIRAGHTVEAAIHPDWRLRIPGTAAAAEPARSGMPQAVPTTTVLKASLVASEAELRPEGDRLALQGRVEPPPGESALTWEILLPPHWVLLQIEGEAIVSPVPRPGSVGLIRLHFKVPPSGTLTCTLQVSYPPGAAAARLESRLIHPPPSGEHVQSLPVLTWRGVRP